MRKLLKLILVASNAMYIIHLILGDRARLRVVTGQSANSESRVTDLLWGTYDILSLTITIAFCLLGFQMCKKCTINRIPVFCHERDRSLDIPRSNSVDFFLWGKKNHNSNFIQKKTKKQYKNLITLYAYHVYFDIEFIHELLNTVYGDRLGLAALLIQFSILKRKKKLFHETAGIVCVSPARAECVTVNSMRFQPTKILRCWHSCLEML